MTDQNKELIIRGQRVTEDEHGNICLNDMWALAGSPENARPADWHRAKRVSNLGRALAKRMVEILHYSTEKAEKSIHYVVGRGRNARTYAHPVLALDFAEYLDPAIGVDVREVFLRYKAHDLTLAVEIMGAVTAQAEYDTERVALRQSLKEHNKMAVGMAKELGATNFEAYNGSGLFGLYAMTRAQLLKHKGLPPDSSHLDHAGHEELAANYFKATQAIAKMKRDGNKGQAAANEAHLQVAQAIRGTIASLGGTMPEDEPALEHIRKAESRVKLAATKEVKTLPSMPPKKAK
jgi:hypothetical protein